MRILKQIGKALGKQVQKRAGLHVYRPVMNAQKWADWAQKSGIPNAKSADELAVTIFKATGNVSIIPEQNQHVIRSTSCVFAEYGTSGLALIWYDYLYYDRHWALRELAGCEIMACTSRAVLVISDDIGDFELTDEMLLSAPVSIVLDGEQTAPLDAEQITVMKSAAGAETITPTEAQKQKASALLLESYDNADASPFDQAILYDLSKGRPVLKSDVSEASKEIAAAVDVEHVEPEPKPEPETQPAPAPAPAPAVETDDKAKSRVVRKSASRQILYGWGSVATKDGESVKDYVDDEVSIDALHDLAHLVVKGARQGALEHTANDSGEIVEALVFDKALCKALSAFSLNGPIELDREAVLIGMHYSDPKDWEEVQAEDWEFSFNATVQVEEPAETEAA